MAGPIHDIAFDGTTYVRVSLSGLIQTSTDGFAWTNRTSGVSDDLWGATFGNGVFVVTGDTGTVLTSADGITWTDRTASSSTTEDLYSVTFSDIFLACGTTGVIIASTVTGDVWSGLESGTTEDLWDISATAGLYTAVGDNSTIVYGAIVTDNPSVTVTEDVNMIESPLAIGVFNATAADDMMMRERPIHDEENLTFFDVVSENMLVSLSSSDHGVFNETVSETADFFQRLFIQNEVITETLAVADTLFGNFSFTINDAFTVGDATSYTYGAAAEIAETVTFDDSVVGSLIIGVEVEEDVALTDDVVTSAVLQGLLSEELVMSAVVSVSESNPEGGGDSGVWTAWVVNTRNMGITEYDRYNFHSFAEYDGSYYGANEKGIYELEGSWDDGWLIKALVKTGLLDFGSEFQKQIPRMYLGIRNDDTMVLKTVTNENVERWYELLENQTGLGKGRVKATKGVKSAYWQFELANITGDDFDLRNIDLMPIVRSRRIK